MDPSDNPWASAPPWGVDEEEEDDTHIPAAVGPPQAAPSPPSLAPTVSGRAPSPGVPSMALPKLSPGLAEEDGPGWGSDPTVPGIHPSPRGSASAPSGPPPHPRLPPPTDPISLEHAVPSDTVEDPWAPPPWGETLPGPEPPPFSHDPPPDARRAPTPPSASPDPALSALRPDFSLSSGLPKLGPAMDEDEDSPWGPPPPPRSPPSPTAPTSGLHPASSVVPEAGAVSKAALEDSITKRFASIETGEDQPSPSKDSKDSKEVETEPRHAVFPDGPAHSSRVEEQQKAQVAMGKDSPDPDQAATAGGVLSKLKGMMSKTAIATPPSPFPPRTTTDTGRTSSDVPASASPASPPSSAAISSTPAPAPEPAPAPAPAPWLARLKANQKSHTRTASSTSPTTEAGEEKNKAEPSPGFKQVTKNNANAPATSQKAKSVLSSWLSGTSRPQVVSAQDDDGEEEEEKEKEEEKEDESRDRPFGPSTSSGKQEGGADLLHFDTPKETTAQPVASASALSVSASASTGSSWWSSLKSRGTTLTPAAQLSTSSLGTSVLGARDLDWLESTSSRPTTQLAPSGSAGGIGGVGDLLGDSSAHVGEIGNRSGGAANGRDLGSDPFSSGSGAFGEPGGTLGASLLGNKGLRRQPLSRAEQEKLRAQQMAAVSTASGDGGYRDDDNGDSGAFHDDEDDDHHHHHLVGKAAQGRYDYDPRPIRASVARSSSQGQRKYSTSREDTLPRAPPSIKDGRPKPWLAPSPQPTRAKESQKNFLSPPVSDLLGDLSSDSFGDFTAPAPTASVTTSPQGPGTTSFRAGPSSSSHSSPFMNPPQPTTTRDPFAELVRSTHPPPSSSSSPSSPSLHRRLHPASPPSTYTGNMGKTPGLDSSTLTNQGLAWLPPPPGRSAAHSRPEMPTSTPSAPAAPSTLVALASESRPSSQPRSSAADDLKLLADL